MTRKVQGFTLVELLVVAVVLAIFAAIVVPQFASTTDEAKVSALRSDLSGIRSAIDLYRQQHGHWPGSKLSSGATCPSSGTAGTGAVNTQQALDDQLTMFTNAAGQACSTTDANFRYGPYVRADALPANAVTGSSTVSMVSTGNLALSSTSTTGGWRYDYVIGKFIADHQDYDDF
ncbi:MAG: prepilin-type N-terminal cleavage/methylation domain-containing protein [Pseudomonadales bacterium]|nr:prepilin-type N-terminal cleavage/methylation domain-containing protein [Pseudomonadales bacterium]MCP5185854.1 prepilin-type N-terminal cleavage/methylation domain-containing protein [Pseudomonadales bacterium]